MKPTSPLGGGSETYMVHPGRALVWCVLKPCRTLAAYLGLGCVHMATEQHASALAAYGVCRPRTPWAEDLFRDCVVSQRPP